MKKLLFIIAISFCQLANSQDSTRVDNFKKTDVVLAKAVEKALVLAEKTGNFAIEQAPLLLQEFYNWHISKSVFLCVIMIIISVVFVVSKTKLNKWAEKEGLDWSDAEYFFSMAFTWIGILLPIPFLISFIYDLVFILVAPKLYLIEYFIK